MLNCQYCNISPSPAALSTSGIVTRERERLLVPVHPHNFNLFKGDDDLSIYLYTMAMFGRIWSGLYGHNFNLQPKRRNRLKASQVPQLP